MPIPLTDGGVADLQPASQIGHRSTAGKELLKRCHAENGSGTSTKMQAVPALFGALCFQNAFVDNKLRERQVATESPRKALGRRLRLARDRAEKTQAEVGERLELTSHSSVGQWERGQTLIGTVNLILAARFYNESLDWLAFGMRGKLEQRIAALPDILREGLMLQIMTAIEGAEKMYQRNPALFGDKIVTDADPRLTEWSAKDKPRPRKKKKPPSGRHGN